MHLLRNGQKRKPWRKFRKDEKTRLFIRKICCAVLILELAVWVRESELPLIRIERQEEHQIKGQVRSQTGDQRPDEAADHPEQEAGVLEEYIEIFGFRIRLEEGVIEFYRKEEVKNIH